MGSETQAAMNTERNKEGNSEAYVAMSTESDSVVVSALLDKIV